MSRRLDITGKKFGRLTVVRHVKNTIWECLCDCGNTSYPQSYYLRNGSVTGCGCGRSGKSPRNFRDITGAVFGRLKVASRISEIGEKPVKWKCKCSCGEVVVVSQGHLTSGHTKSCGCLSDEIKRTSCITHGMSKSKTYSVWSAMIRRCYNKNSTTYKWYGARGIKVCDAWRDFSVFLRDMGVSPDGLEIDRIDNNGNYEPSNCRWVTHAENCQNRRTSTHARS